MKDIIFFLTDEQRIDTLGCYGNRVCRTPNIDRIARDGVAFTRGYTPCAVCTPARASLISGVMPHTHHLFTNFRADAGTPEELDEKHVPFSKYLRDAGYNVASVGKWHVGEKKGPEGYGFKGIHYPGWQEAYDHPDYLRYLDERGLPPFRVHDVTAGIRPNGLKIPFAGILEQPEDATFSYFTAERTIEKLKSLVERRSGDGAPFFLGMNIFGPHLPYYLPKEFAEMYDPADVRLPGGFEETFRNKPVMQRNQSVYWCFDSLSRDEWRKIIAMYWGFVTLIDRQIGRVIEAAEELGVWDDAVAVFSTDHGSFEGSHKMNDKGPAMYDDIYNIPFIIKYPGAPSIGKKDDHLVSLIDLAPTFTEIAGERPADHFEGRSLVRLLQEGTDPEWRDAVFAEFHGHPVPFEQRMIRSDRYKLVVNPSDVNEFYDLQKEPDELVNEYSNPAYAEVVRDHYHKLRDFLKSSGDFMSGWIATMFPD